MSTEPNRVALNGETMGTRWSAVFYMDRTSDTGPIRTALQQAVDEVDQQMSTYKPQSDLMRINGAPVGEWIEAPAHLVQVVRIGLEVGRASAGAFDIAMGDAALAWGFGPNDASAETIRAAMQKSRLAAQDAIEIDGSRIRKTSPIVLDLNGVAKGYGVDRLADVLGSFGIEAALVGIDGEMRAIGLRPDGQPWVIAVEAPDPDRRAPHSILTLEDAAVATSGDYRHWVSVGGRRLSHTMDPSRGAPLTASPSSVTVVAPSCAQADAWATALMVLGVDEGAALAHALGLDALFLSPDADGQVKSTGVGALFSGQAL